MPEFPRLGGQVVRDWIGAAADALSSQGFNGDTMSHLLMPDLVGLVDGPTLLTVLALIVALAYWEGGILLRQLRAQRVRRERQRQREQQQQQQQAGADWAGGEAGDWGDGEGSGAAAHDDDHEHHERQRQAAWTPLDKARHERRRGLGTLALATATLIWLTGLVSWGGFL